MNSEDYNFYENQKLIPQVGYCQSFVDRKWKSFHKNKQKRSCYERKNQTYENDSSWNVDILTEYGQDAIASITASATESDCSVCSESSEYKTFARKTKYQYNKTFPVDEQEDDIPLQYRHVRNSEPNVKTEVYEVIAKLKSVYHMFQAQAEAYFSFTVDYPQALGKKSSIFEVWKEFTKKFN